MFKNINQWSLPPHNFQIPAASVVHIWGCELTATAAELAQYKQLLTSEELQRHERFYFEKHRQYFAIAHGMLHCVLGRYLNKNPQDIRFTYLSHGKPEIVATQNPHQLRFNLSHSGDIALLAVTSHIDIGIDVEQIKSRHFLELAENIMSEHEYQHFLRLPDDQKETAFFHVWVQKEAVIKALGYGLSFSLKRFSVSVTSPARLLDLDGEVPSWTMQEFEMPHGYKAAFASPSQVVDYQCWIFCVDDF